MAILSDQELNIIRGKALVGAATKEDVLAVLERMNEMESLMDEADCDDAFGTEGWRHVLGIDD